MPNCKNKVCVLIPHYNDAGGLIASLKSIDHTEDVDLLVVDDGSSSPPNLSDLRDCFKANGKIKLIIKDRNEGIEHALNEGLKWIVLNKYEFVGRLDSGDLCIKDRFNKQVLFLENNSNISLVGGFAEYVNEKGNHLYFHKPPSDHFTITKKMYYNTMFIHPTVMFRTNIVSRVGYYPTDYPYAEDYAYFFRILKSYKTANLEEILIKYKVSDNSISSQKRRIQVKSRIRVILANFFLGWHPIVGLIRNTFLLFLSRDVTTFLKKILLRSI